MRSVGLALHNPVPDANTIWLRCEQSALAGARGGSVFDAMLRAKGWLAMGGQIIDATVIQGRRPRPDTGREGHDQERQHACRMDVGAACSD
jgi:hypothetical protein